MTPAELDIVMNGAFIYRRPDGSRYAMWGNMEKFGIKPIARSGALTSADLAMPASEVLVRINKDLAA